MRQILFRAKNLDDGKWVQGSFIDGLMGCFIEYTKTTQGDATQTFTSKRKTAMVDESTIGQYTGVEDINGRHIFEGDIVRIHEDIGLDNVGVVVFKDGCFGVEYDSYKPKCFHPLCKTTDEWRDMNATIPIKITFEVLGNIFDDSLILAN